MVKNIKALKDAYINEGSGVIDFLPTLDKVKPDVFVAVSYTHLKERIAGWDLFFFEMNKLEKKGGTCLLYTSRCV